MKYNLPCISNNKSIGEEDMIFAFERDGSFWCIVSKYPIRQLKDFRYGTSSKTLQESVDC